MSKDLIKLDKTIIEEKMEEIDAEIKLLDWTIEKEASNTHLFFAIDLVLLLLWYMGLPMILSLLLIILSSSLGGYSLFQKLTHKADRKKIEINKELLLVEKTSIDMQEKEDNELTKAIEKADKARRKKDRWTKE